MTLSKSKPDILAATERLREWLKDGDTLYFILRHRSASASGLQRIYSVKQFKLNGLGVSDLSSNIAQSCGYAWSESHWGLKVNGCGFSGEQDIMDTVGRLLGIELRYETL